MGQLGALVRHFACLELEGRRRSPGRAISDFRRLPKGTIRRLAETGSGDQPRRAQTDMPVSPDDKVIVHGDIELCRRSDDFLCHFYIGA